MKTNEKSQILPLAYTDNAIKNINQRKNKFIG